MSQLFNARSLVPQPFIDEVLSRTDLVELIDIYIPLKKQGKNFVACCPFHNEKTPSFNVVALKQFYHCFGCGASGNAISFIMNYSNQGFIEALEILAEKVGLSLPTNDDNVVHKKENKTNLHTLLSQITDYYQKELKERGTNAIHYLQQRGFTGEIVKHYQVGYAPSGWHTLGNIFQKQHKELIATGMLIEKENGKSYDRYRDRIMFPIHNRHGQVIGFGGRAISADQTPKYLNSPETSIFQKNKELYGLYQILEHSPSSDTIIIVEGYLDVISLAQHGINNAVAALGTATSSYHIQLLSKYTRQLIFCFDGDIAGKKAAWRALENSLPQLDNNIDVRFIFLPEGHDPDSLIRVEKKDAFLKRINGAVALSQYFIETLSEDKNLYSIAGKSQFINAVKPYLDTIPDSPYKQLFIDELAKFTRLERDRLLTLLTTQSSEISTQIPKQSFNRSPVRLAIALLLQNPQLYFSCDDQINIDDLDEKKHHILQKMLHYIVKNPNASSGSIIELWRDTTLFETLSKLAIWEHNVPEEALTKEFVDIIHFLQKQSLENKISQYIAKSRKQGLTEAERFLLQAMLKQKSLNNG